MGHCLLSSDELVTYAEEAWRKAMRDEMEAIDQSQTWELVTTPTSCRPIGLKWIFELKKNARGEVLRHKARPVVKVYVDDLIVIGENDSDISEFKGQIKHFFEMSDIGHLCSYLGIEMVQKEACITLTYALTILDFAKMGDCNPMQAPLEARVKFSQSNSGPSVDSTYFRSLIGSLRYLTHTHPDLTYFVGFLSRFMEHPTSKHLTAIK
ncbi:unnamed protein product [Spirodela intermedia]|uniref:Reverse transcriptase Ty1/copia-type domain-containing protein n=1 Tax=Spirodela intermedia TaxID=51605 RepID=A0A7I8LLH0_SPIIN|nr:unnamed protein product [Spirodela intermedia]